MLEAVAADVLEGRPFDSASSVAIDAPAASRKKRRAERISEAIDASWDECTLFIVHADGSGDPEAARRDLIEPGLTLAAARHPDLVAAACVPVREIEAWMLADAGAFRRIFRTERILELPDDLESELDPKRALTNVLRSLGARVDHTAGRYHDELGREAHPAELRRLPAFRRFEEDLRRAVQTVAGLPRI